MLARSSCIRLDQGCHRTVLSVHVHLAVPWQMQPSSYADRYDCHMSLTSTFFFFFFGFLIKKKTRGKLALYRIYLGRNLCIDQKPPSSGLLNTLSLEYITEFLPTIPSDNFSCTS